MKKNLRAQRLIFLLVFGVIGGVIMLTASQAAIRYYGDVNNDGSVNVTDLSVLLSNFNKSGTGVQGDLNASGKTDIFDLSILLSHYGKLDAIPGSGEFTVAGTKILDPNGNEFVPKGANLSGPYFVWQDNLLAPGRVSKAKDGWKFNTIELDTCFDTEGACTAYGGGPSKYHFNEEPGYLDNVIKAYTDAGIVVMISSRQVHQGTYATDPTQIGITKVKDWWIKIATKYKDNPYVWFDLLNEPGYPKDRPMTSEIVYRDNYKTLISAVRDTAKANNIILVQASQYGQDTYGGGTGPNSVSPTSTEIAAMDARLKKYSGLLTWGDEIRGNYKNIVYNLHVYSGWGVNSRGQTDIQRDNYLGRYFDLIHQSGVPILVGEVGSCNHLAPPGVDDSKSSCKDTADAEQDRLTGIAEGYAIKSLFRVAPKRNVGIIFWHAQGYDGRILMQQTSETDKTSWTYDRINSLTNPTNLGWQGRMLWDYTHSQ